MLGKIEGKRRRKRQRNLGKLQETVKIREAQCAAVQSLSRVQLFATPWTVAGQASPSITNSWSLLKLMSIELVIPSNHLILCQPLLHLALIFPNIRVFSNESALRIRWPKYWSFSCNISPSNEHPELISFRMDWLDLLEVQGTLKSLLQHHSSKASFFLFCSFFKIVGGQSLYNIVVVLVIQWHESALDIHVSPIPVPPPTSLSTLFLWVFPVHQVRALVSCIQPGLVICFTLDNIHVLMLFSWNIPPSPFSESKNLFYTSVSLFLFCI